MGRVPDRTPQHARLPEPRRYFELQAWTPEAGDGDGEESFDVIVASPRWPAVHCWKPAGILDGRHHVIVDAGTSDQRWLLGWVPASDTWSRGGYLAGCHHDRGATWQA